MELERYYTVLEVAKIFSVSRAQIYKLINAGSIQTVSVGNCIRIKDSVLRAFIDSNTNN